MGLLDTLKSLFGNANSVTNKAKSFENRASSTASSFSSAVKSFTKKSETFTFASLPQNVEELKALPEASLDTPFKAAALAVLALNHYEADKEETFRMLDFLHGPSPLSVKSKQFIFDRLGGKMYVARSFFGGTSPDNDYTPSQPYTVTVRDNPYSYDNQAQGYVKLFIPSSGADSDREIVLRRKGEQWMVWEETNMLGDIRIPKSADPWA